MRRLTIGLAVLGLSAGGCSNDNVGPNLAVGTDAYRLMPAPSGGPIPQDYRIGPLDTVDVTVFQEADISQRGILVDASGNISLPLIGRVHAAGLTAPDLATDLSHRLDRFYNNPQVTVSVASSVAQRVTVEGEVTEPGIYPIQGPTTLLDAVALAKGERENAELREAVIIRYVDGKRTGAVFDLQAIRRGDQRDPALQPRDTVIVGRSAAKEVFHDILRAAPLVAVFTYF